jgi:hypothetical protein
MMILQRLLGGTRPNTDTASGISPSQHDLTPSDDMMDTETEDSYLPRYVFFECDGR